jgi:hypothetical protein
LTDLPVLYTAEEAASILRVRQGWLERQAAARKIPFSLLGGCYRFTVTHLNEIVRIFEPSPGVATASTPPVTTARRPSATVQKSSPLRPRPRTRAA